MSTQRRIAWWESHAGKSVKGQTCRICRQQLKENRVIDELCAKNAIEHYQTVHGVLLESNSRLGAWEYEVQE